jgi:hypothetical protein
LADVDRFIKDDNGKLSAPAFNSIAISKQPILELGAFPGSFPRPISFVDQIEG